MIVLNLLKPIYLVFALLLVLAGITLFVLNSPVPEGATGAAHGSIAAMTVGLDGQDRLVSIGRAPFYFQIVVILMSVCLFYMGVPNARQDTRFHMLMAAGLFYALFVWLMLYTGYETYLKTGMVEVVFGFPVPTNWMLWGIWTSFAFFNLIYVLYFRAYFLHPDDEAAFEELVQELKVAEAEGEA